MTKTLLSCIIVTSMLVFSSPLSRSQECKLVKVGDPFPLFTLTSNLTLEEQKSLNLPQEKTLSFEQFTSEILIIELLNIYCHTCQQQVPIFNQLWDSVQTDPMLTNKVAILGITVGNNAREVAKFQKSFKPQYPILADQDKAVFNCLGNLKGTPSNLYSEKRSLRKMVHSVSPSGSCFFSRDLFEKSERTAQRKFGRDRTGL